MPAKRFWEKTPLDQFSNEQWESLCDGCGLCCLVKIEDEDSGEIYQTSVACRLLNIEQCRCRDYSNRFDKAPMCTAITASTVGEMDWLPETCAYRRVHLKQALPEWHHLITGDRNSVHEAGVSARWFAVSEAYVHPEQLQDFIIHRDNDSKDAG